MLLSRSALLSLILPSEEPTSSIDSGTVAAEIDERMPFTAAGTGTRRRKSSVAAIVASSGVERISFSRKPPSALPRSLAMP